ncbi:MAG: FAD-dependent oxidoreductase [Candidatus Obscuribacterales bacterium]|nr:FAD-dependent oxidoreductase [Candidatus Obscuribacterales bacterium]
MNTTRRDFLKALAGVVAAGLTGTYRADGAEIENGKFTSTKPKVLPWAGDNYTLGHRLRDGDIPKAPDKADRTADFVIVGGGMAGLAAGHFLKDKDFVLLEQYSETGGTSSGGSYRGIDFSRGAVCTDRPYGLKADLFTELGLKPTVISAEETAWHCYGQWHKDIRGNDRFHRELTRLQGEINSARKDINLADSTFSQFLSGYDREFLNLLDNTAKAFFCSGTQGVSAGAGFFMVRALTSDSYVCDGGNSGIARALKSSITGSGPNRCATDCFVWSVERKDNGASVVYSDSSGMHRIDCKHAVVATPPMVALRIIPELPAQLKVAFAQLEYGAFVVANICMPEKILQSPYQSFADAPHPLTQLILAEAPYIASGRYKPEMGSVLTVYYPYSYGAAGRAQVMALNKDKLAAALINELSALMAPIKNHVEQVEITRWGHAVIVPRPGLSSLMNKSNQYTTEWMTFAHSSAGGGQSLEGAISAARNAADACLRKLA